MMAGSDHRDVLVIVQTHVGGDGATQAGGLGQIQTHREGDTVKVDRTSLEILGKAREIGDEIGARIEALVLGERDLEPLAEGLVHAGADIVLLAEHEAITTGNIDAKFAAVLPIVRERKPEMVLMSANSLGLDLAPRLGAALGTGALSDATKLEVDYTDRVLVAKRLTYDGSVEAQATIPHARPQIASLRPGAVRAPFPDETRYGRVERVDVDIPSASLKVKLLGLEDAPPQDVPLEDAEVVVGGGLGLNGAFKLVEELAAALGGAWGASRAAVHRDLAPPERQIGATGKRVAPKLYLACGVSGAFEHHLGILESEVIAAINPDKGAPIFEHATYGLVGDAAALIPAILEELKRD